MQRVGRSWASCLYLWASMLWHALAFPKCFGGVCCRHWCFWYVAQQRVIACCTVTVLSVGVDLLECAQIPCILIDHHYYHKWLIPALNIVLYNATTQHGGGAQLYGEEPWWFYPQNLALNFNIVLPLAVISIPVCNSAQHNRLKENATNQSILLCTVRTAVS
jgi:hypothetical protein